ncbi:MAG: AMP-binding protein [Myxococcota bacterium]
MPHPYAPPVDTLTAMLRWRADHQPDRVGYTFLADGEVDARDRRYADLDRRARAVAAWLQANGSRGDRALMMFEEGLEYLDALFGCMYADVLAVPVHPPDPRRLSRTLPRLLNIAKDAGVTTVLTTRDLLDAAKSSFADVPELASAAWLAVDEIDTRLGTGPGTADRWVDPGVGPDDIAYLQYTSGSTALPKGVMVSHRNLTHQLADFDQGYDHTPDSVIVSWLPATHDLGLVYGRFMPLFIGLRCVFTSPAVFMQKPTRWMQAMARFGGTHSPSPNFGFEVAARAAAKDDLSSLDLSRVQVLLNGAEPIRQESEERFTEVYAAAKLRKSAVTHAMGMSEATAKIMTEPPGRYPPKFVWIDPAAYERNEVVLVPRGTPNARTVASNGFTSGDTRVVIADPETLAALPEDRVGEMWVGGGTVAQGYWNNPEATAHTFRARTADGQGPFLRTGDLAFVHEREIYLCGRLKDVIIIRGQNHHPQDLEWTVSTAHPAMRPNCAAAFGVSDPRGEQLVLVTEVYEDKVGDPETVFGAIRAGLSEHGLAAKALVLLPTRALPKTSSGKIQRTAARQQFLDGTLPTLHRWDAPEVTESAPTDDRGGALLAAVRAAKGRRRTTVLADHLRGVVAGLLGLDPVDIDTDRPFGELGLDSVTAVEMVEAIGKALGLSLQGTLLFDHPTIDALTAHLLTRLDAAPAPSSGRPAQARADVAAMTEDEAMAALLRELDDT